MRYIHILHSILLPNGKLIYHNNYLYQDNLNRILNQIDLNNIQTDLNNINDNISTQINASIIYSTSSSSSPTFNIGKTIKCAICDIETDNFADFTILLNNNLGGVYVTSTYRSKVNNLRSAALLFVAYSINNTQLSITKVRNGDANTADISIRRTSVVFFT